MSERNQIKDRVCYKCGGMIRGKAYAVKEHEKTCDGKPPQRPNIITAETGIIHV